MGVLRVTDDLHAAAKAYAEQHGMKLADVGTVEHMRAIVGGKIGAEEHAALLDRVKDLEERLRKAEKDGGSGGRPADGEDANATILRILSDEVVPVTGGVLPAVDIITWRQRRSEQPGAKDKGFSVLDALLSLLGTGYSRLTALDKHSKRAAA